MMEQPVSSFSLIAWKQRLVFWIGAIIVGLVIVMMTLLSEWAAETYRSLSRHFPWFHFIIPPIGMGFTAWITFRFFPGSERSGIFVPSLATGAGFGVDLANWFPIAPASAMILLTMTAYFSGMLQSPLTSFVIVMEMTNSHEILIPLMATAFLASRTSRLINPRPFYLTLCGAYRRHVNE